MAQRNILFANGEILAVAPYSAFQLEAYDYVKVTYPDAFTEVYTFRAGGASGEIVGVVTLVYLDTAKVNLDTATGS